MTSPAPVGTANGLRCDCAGGVEERTVVDPAAVVHDHDVARDGGVALAYLKVPDVEPRRLELHRGEVDAQGRGVADLGWVLEDDLGGAGLIAAAGRHA